MPASFPGAVKAFTVKSAGNTIQAADCNDLQDEVVAIEQGLINGTAPLNSSNSTFVHLSVTGGSTLTTLQAGASTVTTLSAGASTVTTLSAGASTLADLTVLAPPPSVRVTASASQNIPSGAGSAVTFDTQRWMTVSGMHSTGSNPTRLIAVSSGIYAIVGQLAWQGGSTGTGLCAASVRIDGTTSIATVQDKDPSGLIHTVATQYYFRSSGQYAELIATQNSGSTKSLSITADLSPDFMMTKLR